jgi:hypothetical protein
MKNGVPNLKNGFILGERVWSKSCNTLIQERTKPRRSLLPQGDGWQIWPVMSSSGPALYINITHTIAAMVVKI